MAFCYQAIDASGRAVRDTIQAGSVDEAARSLRSKGLLITRLVEANQASAPDSQPLTGGQAPPGDAASTTCPAGNRS